MIGTDMIYSALVLITLLLIILSVPSIFLSSWTASKQLRKYISLRSFREMNDSEIPAGILNEWNAVKTDIGYATLITEELEKMGSLRAPIFQSELAALLIIIMAFVPGYETSVLILMMILLAVCILTIIYGMRAMRAYSREYINLLREMAENGDKYNDAMYG